VRAVERVPADLRTADVGAAGDGADVDLATLDAVQRRVHWLAVRMVDHANRERDAGGIKVGGHQASSTSMVSLMTALWFAHLEPDDRVAVKPHASPVFHAIRTCSASSTATSSRGCGRSAGCRPTRAARRTRADRLLHRVGRARGDRAAVRGDGPPLRRRPPRAAAASAAAQPLRRAARRRGARRGQHLGGDRRPGTAGLGDVLWVVDLNRQSLDRVVPGVQAGRLERTFADAGWHVTEAKYGRRLQAVFARDGGEALRRHIDEMSNERYQSLFALDPPALRERVLAGADAASRRVVDDLADTEVDGRPRPRRPRPRRAARPLPAGRRRHATGRASCSPTRSRAGAPGWPATRATTARCCPDAIDELRAANGLDVADEWARFGPDTAPGSALRRDRRAARGSLAGRGADRRAPSRSGCLDAPGVDPGDLRPAGGRARAGRGGPPALVTLTPDVAVSTGLGGWINAAGVFDPLHDRPGPPDRGGPTTAITDRRAPALLRWERSRRGQHVELGISEMNLFSALEAFGLAGTTAASGCCRSARSTTRSCAAGWTR
jgi:pyruvate dehydrogenase E1 component